MSRHDHSRLRRHDVRAVGIAAAAILFLLSLPDPAHGCIYGNPKAFEPAARTARPDLFKIDAENIPAPAIQNLEIQRGRSPSRQSCWEEAAVTMAVRLPPSSPATIEKFGIGLRLLENRTPESAGGIPLNRIPDYAFIGRIVDGAMGIWLTWIDRLPADQRPLDFKLEVFLVADAQTRGPSVVVEIRQ